MNQSHNMQPISDHFTNVPAFLIKLWKMVSDFKTDHLICWSTSGKNFIILNQVQFWYELLPLYYKHNNMSSFVRQLNMYGFHKVSSAENSSMVDGEKDEVQFYHPNFQKGKPELLKLIKRKVTISKHPEVGGNQLLKGEELSKVLSDVKQLRGKQASVDSQLAAMKQENAVLWRELAVLRQKHTKQQQIVNKLIQFLVSMVHPSTNRMGVGVKRHYPLMLRGTPSKKLRTSKNNSNKTKNDGPTIHELDNEIELGSELNTTLKPEELLTVPEDDDKDLPLIYSPSTPSSSIGVLSPISNIDFTNELMNEAETVSVEKQICADENSSFKNINEMYWEKPSYVLDKGLSNETLTNAEIPEVPILNILEDSIVPETKPDSSETKIFINPSSQDTLLSNLSNGSYSVKVLNGSKNIQVPHDEGSSAEVPQCQEKAVGSSLAVAAKKSDDDVKINNSTDDCFSGDLGSIIENTQSELDIYKDILHGCGSLDTNTLLREDNRMPFYQPDYTLFNEGGLEYGFSFSQDNDLPQQSDFQGDPMVSGQEVSTYPMLPLEELLDATLSDVDIADDILNDDLSQLNTPQISNIEPDFLVEKS